MDQPEPLALPAERAAPGLARRYVTAAGVRARWSPELLDVALLVTSELVTNAVVHGRSPIGLAIRIGSSTVRIEVSDGGTGAPVLVDRQSGAVQPGGRGLFLLDQLAQRWGSQPRTPEPGKTVWVELDTAVDGRSGPAGRW